MKDSSSVKVESVLLGRNLGVESIEFWTGPAGEGGEIK
jgi:hypothetical protein